MRRLYGKRAEELDAVEWEEVGTNLGMGLRNLAGLFAPEVIVFGGGMVTGGAPRFLATAVRVMREGLRLVPAPRVVTSAPGYNTALLGSIALAQNCGTDNAGGKTGAPRLIN